jgi:Tfp pilus assembly protein PilV
MRSARRITHTRRRTPGRRHGRALVELLVAALLLTLAGTGAAGALTAAERAARRARETAAAEALVAARLDAWTPGSCAPAAGERVVGALRERWQVTVAGGLATLATDVEPAHGEHGARATGVALGRCAP